MFEEMKMLLESVRENIGVLRKEIEVRDKLLELFVEKYNDAMGYQNHEVVTLCFYELRSLIHDVLNSK